MNVATPIPDEGVHAMTATGTDVARAVLEAVAIEAYRSGAVTPAQVQNVPGFRSRWEADSFLHGVGAYHDYTMDVRIPVEVGHRFR
jgi:hypothetical protein